MAFIVNEVGSESDDGPTVITTLNTFGPFDSEEVAYKWAKSEATKRWESPSGLAAKAFETEEWYSDRRRPHSDRLRPLSLPLCRMYNDEPEYIYEDCWFFVKELTSPNAA